MSHFSSILKAFEFKQKLVVIGLVFRLSLQGSIFSVWQHLKKILFLGNTFFQNVLNGLF